VAENAPLPIGEQELHDLMVGGPSGEEPSGYSAAYEPPARGERQ
jgi:hypothetical protein